MKKIGRLLFGLSLANVALSVAGHGHSEEKLSLTPVLKLRPRYEFVNDGSDKTKNASAFTMQTVIGAKLGSIPGARILSGYAEATNVTAALRNYNSTSAFSGINDDYSVVLDPPMTRLTQGYLQLSLWDKVNLLAGRKLLAFDDHRFVGTVGWRQMPQSFDVYELVAKPIEGLAIQVDYVFQRLGIKRELNKTYKKGTLLANIGYTVTEGHNLTAFSYQIQDTHDTFGGTYNGKIAPVTLGATYAVQKTPTFKDAAEAPEVDSYFYDANLGVDVDMVTIGANYHVFGEGKGDTEKGFSTPLATLHKFEGWGDVILGKAGGGSKDGLKTWNVSLAANLDRFGKLKLVYHKFDSVMNGKDYGSEIDFVYSYKICAGAAIQGKAALYKKGSDTEANVTKLWLSGNFDI